AEVAKAFTFSSAGMSSRNSAEKPSSASRNSPAMPRLRRRTYSRRWRCPWLSAACCPASASILAVDSRQCSDTESRSISATCGSSASFAYALPTANPSHSTPASQQRPIRWPTSTPGSILIVVSMDEVVGGELAVGQAGQALDRVVILLEHGLALFVGQAGPLQNSLGRLLVFIGHVRSVSGPAHPFKQFRLELLPQSAGPRHCAAVRRPAAAGPRDRHPEPSAFQTPQGPDLSTGQSVPEPSRTPAATGG